VIEKLHLRPMSGGPRLLFDFGRCGCGSTHIATAFDRSKLFGDAVENSPSAIRDVNICPSAIRDVNICRFHDSD
jgi:hypothetical protein